jgi:hypothetical protein
MSGIFSGAGQGIPLKFQLRQIEQEGEGSASENVRSAPIARTPRREIQL